MAEKILIISPVPLFPGHAGNRERIRTICSELMNRNYTLDFFYSGFDEELDAGHLNFFNGNILQHNVKKSRLSWIQNPLNRINEILNGFKSKAHKVLRRFADGPDSARFNKSLYEYKNSGKILLLKKQVQGKSYKAVIINYAPYSFYFDLFDEQTIKIIDTHDRLTDRYKLFSESNQEPVEWHSLRYSDEQKALSKANVVWAITDEENRHFKKMCKDGEPNVFTLSHLMPYKKISAAKSSKKIGMIGSGNRLNLEGLYWFLGQVWEKLKHYDSEIQFLIAGSICNVLDGHIDDDRIQLMGLFDSPEEIYSEADIFINPMQSGTGLKIKTFEALAHGKLVISTTAGATGLDDLRGNGLVCSDKSSDWIQKIPAYFDDPEKLHNELNNAEAMIKNIYKTNVEVIRLSLETD